MQQRLQRIGDAVRSGAGAERGEDCEAADDQKDNAACRVTDPRHPGEGFWFGSLRHFRARQKVDADFKLRRAIPTCEATLGAMSGRCIDARNDTGTSCIR